MRLLIDDAATIWDGTAAGLSRQGADRRRAHRRRRAAVGSRRGRRRRAARRQGQVPDARHGREAIRTCRSSTWRAARRAGRAAAGGAHAARPWMPPASSWPQASPAACSAAAAKIRIDVAIRDAIEDGLIDGRACWRRAPSSPSPAAWATGASCTCRSESFGVPVDGPDEMLRMVRLLPARGRRHHQAQHLRATSAPTRRPPTPP